MTRTVRFLDLSVDPLERQAFHNAFERVMEHGQLVLGPEVAEFEHSLAQTCGRKFSVGVGSGSSAVYLALKSLGLGPGDEVITTSLSWIATANAITLTGATPVFADIKSDLNIDPQSVLSLITSKTKAVLSVDYTGRLADVSTLTQICDEHQLLIVEDGSQAFGAISNGSKCGGYGIVSAISHNPMKVLAALGEAGSVLTDDPFIKDKLESLRYNGMHNKEWLKEPSINARLDTLQAAYLQHRLINFPSLLRRRQNNASIYNKRLNIPQLVLPHVLPEETHVYYTYTILAEQRDSLMQYLAEAGIECKIQHPVLMSHQEPYKHHRAHTQFAETVVPKLLSIPVHEKLHESDINYVSDKIVDFYSR